ncbi:hypothetical protein CNMCM8980_000060 [Aspergillus fumigatiaffinis]|uniref:Uncharacterized protein n=1 Tax=Aspergillus fumigatiaffinis TaxID=340414 RepID=A0A8H4GJB4_9EURO|nr:hypothetical protein CNMCM5878_008871 [Aspergillus fumigatiaffinis]KAF4223109.1 hypothetical protein CNMCM6457_000737 [Aspergillus fumigatiaffinis]KAF4233211.1 hypothetical protein CNMCM6805_009427 [Aspergillus fumigatiaffinis]KAF4243394.1 hypothetical protein CNMCM8980_000060 [Aspergillus fumigatiaffinis]
MVTSTGAAQRPVSGNKGDDDGPVGDLYSKIATGGFGLWISAVVVLGLSAGIISKTPASPLRAAASYNLTVAVLEFFLAFSSITKPVSPTNARPPARFIIILAFTTMMWGAAFPLMFVTRSNRDTYKVINLDKRVVISIGTGIASVLQNITIACGCLGVSAL